MFHWSLAFAEAQNHICVHLRLVSVLVAFAALLCNRSVSLFLVFSW